MLHADVVTKPLEANFRRKEEAENQKILEEILEKDKFFRE